MNNNELAGAAQQLQEAVTAINTASSGIVTADGEMDVLNQQVQDLQSQLSRAIANGEALPSAMFRQFTSIERMAGWTLVEGTKANTGQSGSKGTAVWTPGDEAATVTTTPSGPYYDAMFFRSLGVARPFLNLFLYRAEFLLSDVGLSLYQALEMDGSWFDGTSRYQPAGQIQRTFRYYDPSLPNWVDSRIPAPIQAGVWLPVEILGRADLAKRTFTYIGVAINGQYYPMNIIVAARSKVTSNPFIHASVQLDSNSKGASYSAQVRKISYAWL